MGGGELVAGADQVTWWHEVVEDIILVVLSQPRGDLRKVEARPVAGKIQLALHTKTQVTHRNHTTQQAAAALFDLGDDIVGILVEHDDIHRPARRS